MTVSLYVYKRWIKSHLRTFLTIQEKVLKRSEQFKRVREEGNNQCIMLAKIFYILLNSLFDFSKEVLVRGNYNFLAQTYLIVICFDQVAIKMPRAGFIYDIQRQQC